MGTNKKTHDEFQLIERFFSNFSFPASHGAAITLGVGDDAAAIQLPEHLELVFSIDTQLADTHFPVDADAGLIAQRAFLSAISDLAAMGATPLCFTLALSLPEYNETWLAAFSEGLRHSAAALNCSLVGGDTTRGPLSITLQVQGTVERNCSLKRSGAKNGDLIFVSGFLGSAAAYTKLLQTNRLEAPDLQHAVELFAASYYSPIPRIALGTALTTRAHCAIDLSDGLFADLQHICKASRVGAQLNLDALPLLSELTHTFGPTEVQQLALGGGDDYELCFTVAEERRKEIIKMGEDMECPVTEIGRITDTGNIECYSNNSIVDMSHIKGYQHF